MKTCPKCGSEQASELTLSGFSLRKAMWFGCGSYVLLDEPEKVLCRTNQCFDQEEINTLQRELSRSRKEMERLKDICDSYGFRAHSGIGAN